MSARVTPSLEAASLTEASEFVRAAGLVLDQVDETTVVGHIDLGPQHHTPWGIVHGGVYASAIESAASIGATTAVQSRSMVAVGLTNTTHFLRSVTEGRVEVRAEAVNQGRTQQLWRVDVRDERDRLLAHGEVRLQNVDAGVSGFAQATAVEAVDGAPGHYRAQIAEGWDIATNANGGYLLALVGRALGRALDRPDPVTVTGHYTSPGKAGPAEVVTEVVKQGRRFGTARATLTAADRPVLTVLGTFGDLSQAHGPELVDHAPPELPEPDACIPLIPRQDTFPPPFMDRVELRLHPDDAGYARGRQSGRPLMRGWFRLPHDEPVDTLALLCAVDAFPPTAFNAQLPVAWTPTVELTAHVRARPAPGWLRCQFSTHFVTGGFLEEDGEIWDRTDRLVAQSRQLALVPQA